MASPSIPDDPLLPEKIVSSQISEAQQKPQSKWRLLLGVVLSLLAGTSLGVSLLFVKLLIDKWQVYTFLPLTISRFSAWSIYAFTFVLYSSSDSLSTCLGETLRAKFVTVFTAFIYAFAGVCWSLSVTYIPIAVTTVIFYMCPLIATCLLALLQRKCVPLCDILLLLIAFTGVAIIADPFSKLASKDDGSAFDKDRLYGILAALVSTLTSASAFVSQQLYITRIHWSVYTLMVGVWGTLIGVAMFVGDYLYNGISEASSVDTSIWCRPDTEYYARTCVLITAAAGHVTVVTLNNALACGLSANIVTMLMSVELLCGGMFDYVFWGIRPTQMAYVGWAIVIAVILLVTFKYWFLERYESNITNGTEQAQQHEDINKNTGNVEKRQTSASDKLYKVFLYSFS